MVMASKIKLYVAVLLHLVVVSYQACDTDYSKTDSNGVSCYGYVGSPSECGQHDDTDFDAYAMCIGCGSCDSDDDGDNGGGGTSVLFYVLIVGPVFGALLCVRMCCSLRRQPGIQERYDQEALSSLHGTGSCVEELELASAPQLSPISPSAPPPKGVVPGVVMATVVGSPGPPQPGELGGIPLAYGVVTVPGSDDGNPYNIPL